MVAIVIFLLAMGLPIAMILGALVWDVGVLSWLLYREWHDEWAPSLWRVLVARRHGLGGILRAH